jgi:hypothetical protein
MRRSVLIHVFKYVRGKTVILRGTVSMVALCILHSPKLEITRETSSTASSSNVRLVLWLEGPITADLADVGGAYTLGKEGAVAEVGLGLPPVSPVEVVGDSGGGRRDADSVIRERENVRSSDCARFCKERGLEICSLSLASRSESDPLFKASSVFLER